MFDKGKNMENEDFLKKTPTSSVSSPYFSYTPKRASIQKSTGTPLKAIEENNENEDRKTPASTNPFDVKSEAFCFPVCSPSIFATFSRNSTDKSRTFRWSIEHLSVLFPADIDETSIPDSWTDPDQELKAQKAIDTFFSQNSIVPSPWSPNSSTGGGGKIKMRRTIRRSSQASSFTSIDASTQTKLTIPPAVDLEALLGEYFTYHEDNSLNCSSKNSSPKESELMNTSSLRRKLFVAKEESCTPKWCKSNSSSDIAWCTPNLQMHSVNTPASDVLSSSPISQRNCSDCCNVLPADCLDFSPIAAPKDRPSVSKSGLRLKAFRERIDEESNSSSDKSSFHSVSPPPESMSFSAELQESMAFPSYSSKEQDTGYATGSMSSSQNATTSVGGTLSRITPVTELMEDCGISQSDMSIDGGVICSEPIKHIDTVSNNINAWPWFPTDCSTPTKAYNF